MNRKKIKAAAQRCLKEFGADKLPVDVRKITRGLGIKLVANSDVDWLESGMYGQYVSDGLTRIVIFDDTLELAERRFTVGHEIGHCYLDHEGDYKRFKDKQAAELTRFVLRQEEASRRFSLDHELQADEFAAQLLCPGNELRRRNLTEAEEVARVCKVPFEAARVSLRGMLP